MKTMKNMPMKLISVLALILMLAFNSCKEEEAVITPVFPELKEISGQPGDTFDITFSANLDWSMKSSSAWCKFIRGEFTETTASGKAGDQTLTVQISDDSWNYDTDDVSELTLTMGETSKVIYKITRPKKVISEAQVTDSEGNIYNEENPIVVKGGEPGNPEFITINVVSEFNVGLISEEIPGWILLNAKGDGVYEIAFNEDNTVGKNIKYQIGKDENYYLPFVVNYNGETVETKIPVCYEGMDENYISFSPIYNSMHNVSKDGKTITASSGVSGTEEVVYEGELPSVVVAKNDDYETVMFVQKGDYMEFPGMDPVFIPTDYELNNGTNLNWIHVSKDADNISFSFSANNSDTEVRSALVYLLPRALYESLKDNLMVLVEGETSSSYERYVILNVLQDYKVPVAPTVSFKGCIDMEGSLMYIADMTGEDVIIKNPENPTANEYIANIPRDYFTYGTLYLEVLEFTSDMKISFSKNYSGLSVIEMNGKQYIKVESTASGNIEISQDSQVIATCGISIY